MVLKLEDMVAALEAEKRLVATTRWKPADRKDTLSAGLEIEGVIEEGISFLGRCKPDQPDKDVTFLLMAETTAKPRAFARIDWRGTRHDNTNKRLCGELWGVSAGRTHFHDTRLHLHLDYETLFRTEKVDLPKATEIVPEPSSFRQLCEISGILLNITNLRELPEPSWPTTPSFI